MEEWLKDSIGFNIKFMALEILLGFCYIDKILLSVELFDNIWQVLYIPVQIKP